VRCTSSDEAVKKSGGFNRQMHTETKNINSKIPLNKYRNSMSKFMKLISVTI
jgi:hypothetical protein